MSVQNASAIAFDLHVVGAPTWLTLGDAMVAAESTTVVRGRLSADAPAESHAVDLAVRGPEPAAAERHRSGRRPCRSRSPWEGDQLPRCHGRSDLQLRPCQGLGQRAAFRDRHVHRDDAARGDRGGDEAPAVARSAHTSRAAARHRPAAVVASTAKLSAAGSASPTCRTARGLADEKPDVLLRQPPGWVVADAKHAHRHVADASQSPDWPGAGSNARSREAWHDSARRRRMRSMTSGDEMTRRTWIAPTDARRWPRR